MKKSIISMMIVGMMIFGTGTSFGTTNNHSGKNSPKVEVVQKQSKHNGKKQCNCPECQKLSKKTKSGPTCKMQPNINKKVQETQKKNQQQQQHFQFEKNTKVQPQHK